MITRSLTRILLYLAAALTTISFLVTFRYLHGDTNSKGQQNSFGNEKYSELVSDMAILRNELRQIHSEVRFASEILSRVQKKQDRFEKSGEQTKREIKKKSGSKEGFKSGGFRGLTRTTDLQVVATTPWKKSKPIVTFISKILTENLPPKKSSAASTDSKGTSVESIPPNDASMKKISKSESSEPVCKIPVVDPFSPVVMKYIKQLPKTQCAGVKVSHVEDGTLKFDLKNVKGVVLIFLNRVYDFWLDYSEFISFTKRTEKRGINNAKHLIGCIGNADNGHVNQELKVTNKQCNVQDYFNFTGDGRIMIVEKNTCITYLESKEKDKLELNTNCSSAESEFQLTADGNIKHKATGLCLHVSNETEKNTDLRSLTLSNNCSSERSKFFLLEPLVEDVKASSPVTNDNMKLMVLFANNTLHVEFHLHAATVPAEKLPEVKVKNEKNKLKANIAIMLLDSQSAANFRRLLPETMNFLDKDDKSFIFKGNTIVGDATTPQVVAMLTGNRITDLPEGRRSMPNTYYIDRWPFIFKELHDHGYITQMAEDDPIIGAFNLRLWGFLAQPTTHYGRPYWLAAMGKTPSYLRPFSCIGDKFLHRINMDYLLSLYKTNRDRKKFSFILSSHICHDEFNGIQYADGDIVDVLKQTQGGGLLDDTILIILGDHGSRFGPLRESIQGKIEERLPFLSITLPQRIIKDFPDLVKNLKRNTNLLTSHFDLYATLKHTLSYPSLPDGIKFGNSLFTHLNETERTCEKIGVEERWCPCLTFEEVNISDPLSGKLAKKAVSFINEQLSKVEEAKSICTQLSLDSLISIKKKIPNRKVQKYFFSASDSKCATCKIVETQTNTFHDILYEVTIKVAPSGGLFEATLHVYKDELIHVHPEISRINRYGDQARCVQNKYPHLRKFCYCKE